MRIASVAVVFLFACKSTPKSAAKPIVDTGFSTTADGFAFANFGDSTNASELTATEVTRLFGAASVCVGGTASPCTLTGAAQNWMTQANKFLTSGRCEGFNILSQLIFTKAIAATSFGAATTNALTLNAALERELAYWSSTQLLAPTSDDQMQLLAAKDALTYLQTALADKTKIYRIGMVNVQNKVQAGAHTVTPIGIDQGTTGTTFSIRVYDSNVPDAEQLIAIDTTANTWSYKSTDANGVALSGDTTNPLYVFTSAPHLGTYECPFCGSAQNYRIATQGVHITYADYPNGTVTQQPVFTQNVPTGAGLNPGLYVQVVDGMINVSNKGGTQNFAAGQFGYTPSFQQPPVIIPANPSIQFTPPPSFSSGSMATSANGASAKPGDVDCVVRDDLVRSMTDCGAAPAKKLYCNRDDDTTPTSGPTSMSQTITLADGSTVTQLITIESSTTVVIGTAMAAATPGRDANSSITSCAATSAPTSATVSVSFMTPSSSQGPLPVETFVGNVQLSGNASATPDIASWQGPGQPMPTAVTQDGTTTTTYVADMQTPDTTPPTVGTAIQLTPAQTSVAVSWGAAVDPDNTTLPAPPLSYRVAISTTPSDVASVAAIDAVAANVVVDYTANITTATATGLTAETTYYVGVVVEDVAGNKSLYAPVSTMTTQGTAKLIFVLSTAAGAGGNLGGITGADAFCNADPIAQASGGSFKALLVDGSARVACSTANCTGSGNTQTDWALAPNTTYANAAGNPVGTTDAHGLFAFPLANAIGTKDAAVFTGLAPDWTLADDNSATPVPEDCDGWIGQDGDFADFGYEMQTDIGAFSAAPNTDPSNALPCSNSYPFYCAQQ